jgi:hypothetical protein
LALALGLGAVSVANAATVGIGYDNVGISAGPGLNTGQFTVGYGMSF